MSGSERVLNLDINEKTLVHTPNRNITHHWVRRTKSGFETCSTITDWRPIPEETIRSLYRGNDG